jgi:hypothetical protein
MPMSTQFVLLGADVARGYHEVYMKWQQLLLALIRCELQAKYNYLAGWQLSAKGALPITLLAFELLAIGIGHR